MVPDSREITVDFTTDAVGFLYTEGGGAVYIRQPNGLFLECWQSDYCTVANA
jgi:hypothetical protein